MGTDRLVELNNADLPSVADVHLRAFTESGLSGLGHEAVRRYYDWQLNGPHDVWARGVSDGDSLLGFCFAGNFRGAVSGYLRKNRRFIITHIATHPKLLLNPIVRHGMREGMRVLRRFRPTSSPTSTQSSSRFSILAIAVDPSAQGRGVGRMLMDDAEESARTQGFGEMRLTVDVGNAQAIRFYEGLGWARRLEDGVWRGSMKKELETSG